MKRTRADWPVVLASWLLLASALSLLSAGTLYTDAVTLAGLHRELGDAAPADRSIVVKTKIVADRLDVANQAITPELERLLEPTGGQLARVVRSSPYAAADADPETVTDLTEFASYESVQQHARLLDGRWPEPGRTPLEATLPEASARLLGLEAGDHVSLVSRLRPAQTVDVLVTGVWRSDSADPYWLGEPLILAGSEQGGRFTTRGPFVVEPGDVAGGRLSSALDAEWRAIPDLDGFRPETLDTVAERSTALLERVNAALPSSNQATVLTKLPTILTSVDRSVLVTQSGILLLLIQFGVLAGYAVILVAGLLIERRRTESALLRARGAGLGHLAGMALGEALLITVPAVLVAPWLAALLVGLVRFIPALSGVGLEPPLPGPSTWAVAIVGGILALLALVVPTLATGVSIAGVRATVGRQVGRTLPQRLGLDLALVALAALALFQLRLYGAPLTRNARGTLGVDPLLVAAPAIGLIGGAVLATRIVPRTAELMEKALSRTRGLVASLGGRQLARRPLRYTRSALLLILAGALGTFASAHAATWTQSQADQAAYASGADLRMTPGPQSEVPGWALGAAVREAPGVTAATPVVRASVDLGSALRDAPLVAVDGKELAGIVRVREDAARDDLIAGLGRLADARPEAPGIPVPDGTPRLSAVISSDLEPVEGFEPIPKGYEGAIVTAYLADGDGRIWGIESAPGALGEKDVRIEIPLAAPGGGAVTPPFRILALGVELSFAELGNALAQGTLDLESIEASPDASGDAWTALPSDGGSTPRWTVDASGGGVQAYRPPAGSPNRITLNGLFPGGRTQWRHWYTPERAGPIPTLVSPAFLARTGAAVGDTLQASVFGVPVSLDLVGRAGAFPPLDPSSPYVVVDGLALDLARFARSASLTDTDEWWLGTAAGESTTTAAALEADPIAAQGVVDRTRLLADLTGDPLGLGVIGILGLGSIAALVFAAIGFLVSTTVSTQERLGEFALLKAVGLSPRQLLVWLSMESVSLLVVGLVAGTALGLVLAWLALPFATLTSSGAPPIPAAEVVIPPDAVLPSLALAGLLLLATIVLIRRLIPAARTSAVLRARDE